MVDGNLETVLREFEFNQWVGYMNLKGLGGFWIRNYVHTASTLAFQPEEHNKIEKIIERINISPHLKNLKHRIVGGKYPVLQIDVPIRLMGPRHYSLTQLRDHFVWAKLHEDRAQNKLYKSRGRKIFDYLLNNEEAQQHLKRIAENNNNLISIDNLKKVLFSSRNLRELPYYQGKRHRTNIEDVLFFLELGHPLRSRVKKDDTVKVNIPSPLPEDFLKGHYTECGEINIAPEGSIVEITNEDLISILRYRKRINKLIREYDIELRHYLAFKERKISKSNMSRIRNDLEKALIENSDEEDSEFPIVRSIGGELTPGVIVARNRLYAGIERLTSRGEKLGGCEAVPNYNYERVMLSFERDVSKFVKFVRMRGNRDIKKEIMFIIDWEDFEYGTIHAGTVQGAMCWMKFMQEVFNRKIKSRGKVRSDRFTKTKIEDGYSGAKEIIKDTTTEINQSGASIMAAYNASYDFLKPKEFGEFRIGSLNREPRKVSTVPFFERVGIPARDVLDPLRPAKANFNKKKLANCKLVTVSAHLDEKENFELEEDELGKIINYRNGREMEIGRRTGNWEHLSIDTIAILEKFSDKKLAEIEDLEATAGELQCFYADTDLEKLIKIIQSDWHDKIIKDVSFMSDLFQVDFFLLYHDPKRVDKFLNRAYYKRNGTWRSEMMPRYDNIVKAEQRARNYYQRHKAKEFPKQEEVGFFEDVYKVYIPFARFFREEIKSFLDSMSNKEEKYGDIAEKLFEYVDKHENDNTRSVFLSQFENAVFEWPLKDYIFYNYTKFRYEKLKNKHKIEHDGVLDDPKISFFGMIYNHLSGIAKDKNDVFLLKKLRSSSLDQVSIESALDYYGPVFVEELGLKDRKLQALFNLWISKHNQERRISAIYGIDPKQFEDKFNQVYKTINDYLDNNNLSLVHTQNNVLYLKGNRNKIATDKAPFILIDEIDKVFLTEHPSERRKDSKKSGKKVYYPRYGAWEGIKDSEDPMFNLNIFEMEHYNQYLQKIFGDKQEEAIEDFCLGLETLVAENIDKKDLLWYSKNKQQYEGFMYGKRITFFDWDLSKLIYDEEREKHYFLIEVDGKKSRERLYIKKDEDGLFYYVEKNKRRTEDDFGKGKYVEVEKNIYALPIENFQPDWEMYKKRMGEMAEIFFNPLVGKREAKRMVGNVLGIESMPRLEEIEVQTKPQQKLLL